MIRRATLDDVPAILDMVERLHAATGQIIPLDRNHAARFIRWLLASEDGLVLVLGDMPAGMLLASVSPVSVAPVRVAAEHGWWVEPYARGQGRGLLDYYEEWARSRGCFAARMSTPEIADKAATILRSKGYAPAEIAWAKVL